MDAKSGIDVGLLMRVVEDVFFTEYFMHKEMQEVQRSYPMFSLLGDEKGNGCSGQW